MSAETKPSSEPAKHCSDVDHSLRHPVMFFFTAGSVWLAIALFFGIVASIKLYAPGFLGECSGIQYGRSFPAHINALIYGWGVQVALGVLIWLMARLAKRSCNHAITILVAGHFWNLAVALGMIGILLGYGTGKPWMEFPTFVWPVLLAAYAIIGISTLITFRIRREKKTNITQWYLLGAVFWFPWIFFTANLYVNVFDVQPLMATAVNAWFRSALTFLFFAPIAIGSAYYLIPKVTERPIHNSTYSIVGFWALAVIAPWAGMQSIMGAPIPTFLQFTGATAGILIALPLFLAGINLLKTTKGELKTIENSPTLRFTMAGVFGMLVLGVLSAVLSFPSVLKITQFTNAGYGYDMVALYGFFSMSMFGAIYHIVPRITRHEWLSPRLIRFHFMFSIYGIVFIAIFGTLVAGFQQGAIQENIELSWMEIAVSSMPHTAGMGIAWLFILISNAFFFLNLTFMWLRLGKRLPEPTLLG
jgi:cytochrome c oxidase cbb3-type subunit 1